MALFFLSLTLVCMSAVAAPQSQASYRPQMPQRLQQINSGYYLESPHRHYHGRPKQVSDRNINRNAPAHLETLEPDSEVELIQGAQPQQPPQQMPVSPNLPGLIPGQRVYIVNMPVPGYRPGTISGYQPVYVIAAAPNGNPGYPGALPQAGNPNYVQSGSPNYVQAANPNYVQTGHPNYIPGGYQNTILLDPSGQTLITPYLSYQRAGPRPPPGVGGGSGVIVPEQNQYLVNRVYNHNIYQDPAIYGNHPSSLGAAVELNQNSNAPSSPSSPTGPTDSTGPTGPTSPEGTGATMRLAQLVSLNSQASSAANDSPHSISNEQTNSESERSRSGVASDSSTESENGANDDDDDVDKEEDHSPASSLSQHSESTEQSSRL